MCKALTEHCEIGYLITLIINIIKIAVPIVLVIMGMLDFAKASTKGSADEMAKSRAIFIKRCIEGQDASNASIWSCVENLIDYKGSC